MPLQCIVPHVLIRPHRSGYLCTCALVQEGKTIKIFFWPITPAPRKSRWTSSRSGVELARRFSVLYEAAGLTSDFATCLVRTLLSEGCIRYETVERTAKVLIPYAHDLAARADTRAVRLRRDFGALLTLIAAHAILHQCQRERDEQGRIVATLADYAAVYDLVIDIIGEGVQAKVSAATRETVEAVRHLSSTKGGDPVGMAELAAHLHLDRSTVNRRVRVALAEGYLVNLEAKEKQPAKLVLGDPLPEQSAVLPKPDEIAEKNLMVYPSCTSAQVHK